MIRKCKKDDSDRIEEHLSNNIDKCLYLYLDFNKYRFNNPNVNIYVQEIKDEIKTIILVYYTGMHIFSKDHNLNYSELAEFILDINPVAIFAEKVIIDKLKQYVNMDTNKYNCQYGNIWKAIQYEKQDRNSIQIAKTEEEFLQIANLLMSDEDIGSSYDLNTLMCQIRERIIEGYSRSYIIKNEDKVIAHVSTGAENEKLAIINYVVVDENYRKRGLATKLLNVLFEDLIKEGKQIYFINYSKESTMLYKKLNCEICCDWGKLYR